MADHSAEGGMLHSKILAEVDDYAAAARQAAPEFLAALRAVVELHAPDRAWLCCNHEGASVHWPCSTIEVIAEQLGIKDQERIEGDERRG